MADDSELPDPSDMDQDDDAEFAQTRPCPECGRAIYEDAEVCPHCGSYISPKETASRKPLWILIGVGVCLIVILIAWLR